MRFSSFSLAFVCLSLLSIATQAHAQSFIERVQTATTSDLVALHEEFDVPRGDVDGDGQVQFADFLVLYENYGQSRDDLKYEEGDLNLDGVVDLGDFGMHSINFGDDSFEPDPPSRPANANLGLSRDNDGFLTISSENPTRIVAVEIVTETGTLTSPFFDIRERRPDSSPFTFTMDSAPNRVAWGNLGSNVRVRGDFSTSSSSSASDLEVRWIEPRSYDVYSLPVGAGDALTGTVFPEFRPPELPSFDFQSFDAAETLDEILAIHEEQNIPRGELDGFDGVSRDDIRILDRRWGSAAEYSEGDLNLDGTVGLGDLAILLANFDRDEWVADEERIIDDPANLTLSADEFGRVQLTSDRAVELGGIELAGLDDASLSSQIRFLNGGLFERQLVDTGDVIVLGSLSNSPPTINGETLLGTQLEPGGVSEVTLRWFETGSSLIFESGPFSLTREFDISAGDINGDGVVSFADFLDLSNTYGQAVEPSTGADITGDGRINFPDFLILSHNFGLEAQAAEPVPEPTIGFRLALLVAVGLALTSRKIERQTSQTSTA